MSLRSSTERLGLSESVAFHLLPGCFLGFVWFCFGWVLVVGLLCVGVFEDT